MEHIKHPLVGDPLYGPQDNALVSRLSKAGYVDDAYDTIKNFPRQALHAAQISFIHPRSEDDMTFDVPLPDDMAALLGVL